uniref:Uncharacterized protein n=1 Tax=Daphnia galeata TaxID=27404 RepID=A0A8J2RRD8_9CRUS|nr:unnamed protein product [Daphnia galeata]
MCVYSDVTLSYRSSDFNAPPTIFVSFMFFVSLQVEGPSDPHLLVLKTQLIASDVIRVSNLFMSILLWRSISPDQVSSNNNKISEPTFDAIDNKSSQEALRGSPDQKKKKQTKKQRKKRKSEPHAKKFDEEENNSAAIETPHQASGHEVQPETIPCIPTPICMAYLCVCMSIVGCWSPFLSRAFFSTICEPDHQLVESPATSDEQIDYAILESWLEAPKLSEKSEPDAEKTDVEEKDDPVTMEEPDPASDLKTESENMPTPRSPPTNSHTHTYIPIYPCLKEIILTEFVGLREKVEKAWVEHFVLGKKKADATEPPEPASEHKVGLVIKLRPRSPLTNPELKKSSGQKELTMAELIELIESIEFSRSKEIKQVLGNKKADPIQPPEPSSDQKVEFESKPRPRSSPTNPEPEKKPGHRPNCPVLNEVSGKDKADAIEPPEESDHKVKMESTQTEITTADEPKT